MRGGALPLMFWATLLALFGIMNAIWTADTIQVATFAAGVLAVASLAGALALRSRDALRRGEPPPSDAPEAIPRASSAAVLVALGLGMLVFGFAFGHFPIYLGSGVILAGLGRLWVEKRAQRRALSRNGKPAARADDGADP